MTKTDLPQVPHALAGVALIDAPTCAAAGGMSVSWWHEQVRIGKAPPAAVSLPRCARWRLSQVQAFWLDFANDGQADTQAAQRMTAQAKHASNAARQPAAVAKAQASRAQRALSGRKALQPPAQPPAQQHSAGGV
jgi:hypothetical protein